MKLKSDSNEFKKAKEAYQYKIETKRGDEVIIVNKKYEIHNSIEIVTKNGVEKENMMNLPFPDNNFILVISINGDISVYNCLAEDEFLDCSLEPIERLHQINKIISKIRNIDIYSPRIARGNVFQYSLDRLKKIASHSLCNE